MYKEEFIGKRRRIIRRKRDNINENGVNLNENF